MRTLRGGMRLQLRPWAEPGDPSFARNQRNVLIDGMGVAIANGIATFLPVLLVRLEASNVQVGLLTSMPAIMGAICSLPVGQFLQREPKLVQWYARSRLWVLTSYALTGIVLFFLAGRAAATVIVGIWAVATVAQVVLNVCFTLVMSGVAGPTKRIALMSRRWTTMGVVTASSVAGAGWLLSHVPWPRNYELVFLASFSGGLLSYIFSLGIVLPEEVTPSTPAAPWYKVWSGMGSLVRQHARFGQFVLSQFVLRCGLGLAIPLLPLYWVRVLHASDAQIGLINTANSVVLVVAFIAWSWLARRRGPRTVLLVCCLGLSCYPPLVSLTHQVWILPLLAAGAGVFAAGLDLVLFDLLVGTAPHEQRGPAIGLYHTTTYLALFVAPLLGTAAVDRLGLPTLLVIAGGLRLAGMLLFATLGVGRIEDVQTLAPGGVLNVSKPGR
ncbi:MAG: MFS transporter [Herpetosiphon sp.]